MGPTLFTFIWQWSSKLFWWQKPIQYYKAIILQLQINELFLKDEKKSSPPSPGLKRLLGRLTAASSSEKAGLRRETRHCCSDAPEPWGTWSSGRRLTASPGLTLVDGGRAQDLSILMPPTLIWGIYFIPWTQVLMKDGKKGPQTCILFWYSPQGKDGSYISKWLKIYQKKKKILWHMKIT